MVVALWLGTAAPVAAQDADAWRGFFAACQEALGAEDSSQYAEQMALAWENLPAGHLNRPFEQYPPARGAALVEDADAAASWLPVAWDEGIESLMISFATCDLSCDEMKTSPGFEGAIGLASEMELGVERLGGSVCLLSAAGSNVVAQVGDDGVFLIDTGYFPVFASLQRAVSSLESGEVSRLLITHLHDDHMGAAAELGTAATPRTTAAMDEPYLFMEGVEMPAKEASAGPDVEIASDTIIVVNGEEVRIFATPAHTPGDLVIYFTESGVVVGLLEQEAGDTDGDADPNETNKRCRDVD